MPEGMNRHHPNWLFAYQAVVYAAGLLLATGLVTTWRAWYSTSLPYRNQTDALLNGDLALSRSVGDLKFDHTWSEQGVHQVWGLGVPLWRLPFEAAAKWCGFDGFPDRLAFGLFALLVCFVTLKVWVDFGEERSEPNDGADSGWRLITGFGAGFLILLLFPPFLTLLQVRGAVWEEAVAYEYLLGILQLSLLLALVRKPAVWRLLLVCALAGVGPLIRPTLVFYGFGTLVIAIAVWVRHVGQASSLSLAVAGSSRREEAQTSKEQALQTGEAHATGRQDMRITQSMVATTLADARGDRLEACPKLGRVLTPVLIAALLFCLGGGVLWLTNLNRFGDGFEFGHKLNVQTLYGSMHATRFDHPFEEEPLQGATAELFGALFLAEKFNGADWYRENIFPGQSPTVRWREFYFRTYDWSYLPLLLLGWGGALVALWSRGARAPRPPGPAPSPDNRGDLDTQVDGRRLTDLSATSTLGVWSLLAVIPLAGFYLYAPVISSRYMMDLAPAFAAALAGAWLFIAHRCEKRWSRVLACVLLCAWLGTQFYLSRSVYGGPASVTAAELKVLRERRPDAANGSTTNTYTADDYGQSLSENRSGIPFDGTGWSAETGAVMPLVILFVKDAEFLELEFETQPHPRITANPEDIRAKVGLEYLERQEITRTDNGWRIRFRGPQQPRWRDGLQGVFVATVPKEFLAERTTPWVLKNVRWREAKSADPR